MTPKQRYEEAKWRWFIRQHPESANNMESFERGFRSVAAFPVISKATHLERAITDFLTYEGHQASKITTTGQFRDNTQTFTDVIGRQRVIGSKTWIPGNSTKGVADVIATIYGLKWDIEVKYSKSDRQRATQVKYEASVAKAHGIYSVVKSWEDFITKYDEFMEQPQVKLMKEFYNKPLK